MEIATAPLSRKQLIDLSGGLALMAIFTGVWVFIAEVALDSVDHGAVAGAFGIIIIYFVISYIKLTTIARAAPKETKQELADEKANNKALYIVMAIEAVAILAAKYLLSISGHGNLFVPAFALIVGLHFFPLGKIFNRTFYYFLGSWITLMAVVGFGLIYQGVPSYWPNPVVGIGCALATVANGIRIIKLGGIMTLEV